MLRVIGKDEDGRICAADYALLCSFWEGRGSPPARAILPGLGVFADEMASGFLYLDATGSGLAVMAWTATDPAAPVMARGRAMREVIDFLEKEAAALGYHALQCTHGHPSFVRLFKNRGYATGDSGLVHLFKSLDAPNG